MLTRRQFLILAILLPLACAQLAAAASWKAGTAKVNITPEKYMWMSGYGGRNKPAEGKLTDLWAKALVLEDAQGQRCVLVTLDLVGIDRDSSQRVCQAIEAKHKLPRRAVALCTSHTHTGPVVGRNLGAMYFYDEAQGKLVTAYTEQLEEKIIRVVGAAMETLEPAQVSWGQGRATFAVNRRNNREADVPKIREEGILRGPVDHDAPVLVVRNAEGKLRTMVCGYACHATVLSFYQWSGDWPGFAQIELEKRHPEAMAMFWAGCGADQNPLPRRSVELAQQYGSRLADAVDEVLAGKMQPIGGDLKMAYDEIELAFAHIPTEGELKKSLDSTNRYEAGRARYLLATLERQGGKLHETYPYPVQTWQLGNGPTFVVLGGEVVVDYALRLKYELGLDRTWVAGYSNDVMAYIPSERVLREGGYEGASSMIYYGQPSPWAPGLERRIVAQVRSQVASLRGPLRVGQASSSRYRDHSNLLVYLDEVNQEHPIKTPADWARRRAHILEGMQHAMGPLPDVSKPLALDVKEGERKEGEGYTRIEVSYRSDPGDRVTAHLYIPDGIQPGERRPAMLALHPTSNLGKLIVANEGPRPNRGYALELAQRGYVVLAPDYPSFGGLKDYDFANDSYASGTMKAIVNHMRGVDLLVARDDVDGERIGVIGHSLGGHNAMFVGVFDERLKVMVSSCGWTPFHDYYGGKIAGWTSDRYMPRLRDVYQLDPDQVPFDFYEIVAALAPRAFFSCSPVEDSNFDVAGVKKAISKAQVIYHLLGADDQLVVRYPAAQHDFPTDTRYEAYEFIDRVLKFTPTKK